MQQLQFAEYRETKADAKAAKIVAIIAGLVISFLVGYITCLG